MTVKDDAPSDAMRWPADTQDPAPQQEEGDCAPLMEDSGVVVLEWRLVDLDPTDRAVTTDWAWTVNIESAFDGDHPYVRAPVTAVEGAQWWAQGRVWDCTDLVVTGWQEIHAGGSGPMFVAALALRVHHMSVLVADGVADGVAAHFEVTPRKAAKLRRQMRRPGGVLVFDDPLPTPVEGAVRRRRYVPAWQAQLVETVEHRPVTAAQVRALYGNL